MTFREKNYQRSHKVWFSVEQNDSFRYHTLTVACAAVLLITFLFFLEMFLKNGQVRITSRQIDGDETPEAKLETQTGFEDTVLNTNGLLLMNSLFLLL